MPTTATPLWLLTWTLLVLFPTLNFIYWPAVLEAGELPTDADSIAIPMFDSIITTFVVTPFLCGVAWLCFRRYNPKTRLMTWRRDRPLRALAATVVFGGLALFLLFGLLSDVSVRWPWYEYLWAGYFLLWVAWLMGARAALIDQRSAASH